jgi:surfactin family lipopeptide synthetase A
MEITAQLQPANNKPGPDTAGGRRIPHLAQGNVAPLSFAQEQIWLHAQLVPEIPIYNEPVTIHRHGPLNVPALERALTEIVRRHESWRTGFGLSNGEPVQIIQPASPVVLPVVDLSQTPAADREAEARRLALEDALRPLDLTRPPLFHALLIRFNDTEHRLFLTLHHIIFDGYSIYRVLLPELSALYTAFSEGKEARLDELSVQHSDFARWEREWLSRNGRLSSQLAYWRKQLSGNLSVAQLPYDQPRPAVQSFRGGIQPVALSRDLADSLRLLGRRDGATLFMTLLAAFATLLQRYSSQQEVLIGTVSSGRKRSELEGLLGYFLNPVVLRSDMSGDPTFRELLRRTRDVTLDALSNDDAPFTQVVNEVHPNRSLSFNPLFQVLFTLEPPLPETQDGWRVMLTQSEVDTGISKFDLCLELDDRPTGIVGRFKYSTDLFEAETVARMAGHFATLLQGISANPDQHISELPILTEPERQRVSVAWNDTKAEYPADLCLHQLFAEQAARTPHATSVVAGRGQLTYAALDSKSNQLAAHLRKRGIGPERPVGVCFEPSSEMIVATLGVLKAGGVSVPLDPTYPADRLVHLLQDTQLGVVLTQRSLLSPPPVDNLDVLYLDSDWNTIAQESAQPVPNECKPENLAYLIYTSGSTGKPKGVEITHQNLVHSTYARSLYYGPDAGRFLLLSSFAFDSSLVGILGTLCRGGALVMTPGPLQANLPQLAQLVAQHRISQLLCVPSLYSLLLEQAKTGQLASLRTAIVAGESCPAELVQRHYELLPNATLFNEYGPTEAAVWTTVYKCEPGQTAKLVPIGRPIPNARVYVLDPGMNLLPVGVPGELYVGGPGVVRGYLNRPEETAERFVPDPFSLMSDARLYKTGDLVRYLADGNLEFLGRLDHQVKLRGFRIELEEIEAAIAEYKGVRQAVVELVGKDASAAKLVAYVLPTDRSHFDAEELRRFLSRKFPEAMVPSAYVMLESLPLTPNGKVDRPALPKPAQPSSKPKVASSDVALESKLIEIWESVLDKHPIGADDNFFDLGGHSLLVAKLLLRIEKEFGWGLSMADVFRAPTVRQLATLLSRQAQFENQTAIVPIQPHGSKPPLFWVRGGPLFLPLASRLGPDQPLLGLHLPASDASRLPVPYRFEDIAGALVSRLREVQPQGPYYLAGLCVNGVVAYEMACQLVAQGQRVAMLVMVDAQNPVYYRDFSQESWPKLLFNKTRFHSRKLTQGGLSGLPAYLASRLERVRLRLSVFHWRIHHKLGLKVNKQRLHENLDTIVHPTSYLYRPQPFPGRAIFFQSTDCPAGRYWDFYASWNGLIGGALEVHKIPGGHESMFYQENVAIVADRLQSCLSEAQRNCSKPPGRGLLAG